MFFLSGEIKATEPIRFGVVVGLNDSKLSSIIMKSRIGFHAGVKAEFNFNSIAEGIYLDAAALISLKGGKFDWGDGESSKYNPYYLEVPIRIGYKYAVNDKFSILGNCGPYIGYGIMGKVEEVSDGVTHRYDIFSNYLNRFDYGLGFRVGVELKQKIQVTAGYDFGLGDSSEKMQNKNLTLSVAFMF